MTPEQFFADFAHIADAPKGVQKLRELILQLAVRGKLVQQDPADEPAAELLERIRAEKARLVKEKKIRNSEPLSQVNADEAPYELPQGWVWVRLGNNCILINGDRGKNYPSRDEFVSSGIAFINAGHLQEGKIDFSEMNYISENRFDLLRSGKIQQGDLLFCLRGSLGKSAIVKCSEFGAIASSLVIVRPFDSIDADYLLTYFSSSLSVAMVNRYDNGSAQPNLSATDLGKFCVPLPPISEQHRIVTKVGQLMALCDELESKQIKQQKKLTRLNNASIDRLLTARDQAEFADSWSLIRDNFDSLYSIPDTINKLRQAILQLAVQGKLIASDNRGQWKEGVLGDVIERSEAGWSPQCETRPRTGNEWGVLKVSAVSWDCFNPDENKALPSHLNPRPEYEVKKGDFLISRANTAELVAKSVVVADTPPHLSLSDKTVRLHFRVDASPQFFCLVNNSPAARGYYARIAGGTSSSMKNVTRQQILALPVLVPPLAEQNRIVAKVDQLMALCDSLEARLTKTQLKAEKLTSSAIQGLLTA